jgi:uncharacterized surface protein with fasciclin (FAS1) repeats
MLTGGTAAAGAGTDAPDQPPPQPMPFGIEKSREHCGGLTSTIPIPVQVPRTAPGKNRRKVMVSRRQLAFASMTALAAPSVIRSAAGQEGRTALDLINRTPAISHFADFIKNLGLEEQFATGQHGYFIPVDAAVERIPALQADRYRSDKELGRQTVLNHVTDFTNPITGWAGFAWSDSARVKALAGRTLTLASSGMSIPRIGGHPITYMNYRASNGLCHAIDGVLAL